MHASPRFTSPQQQLPYSPYIGAPQYSHVPPPPPPPPQFDSPAAYYPPNPPQAQPFAKPKLWKPRVARNSEPKPKSQYHCKSCDITLTGLVQLQTHESGKKHQTRITRQQKESQSPFASTPAPSMPTSQKRGPRPKKKPSAAATATTRAILKDFEQYKGHALIGLQHAKLTVREGQSHGTITCQLCRCTVDSRSGANLGHFVGHKHYAACVRAFGAPEHKAALEGDLKLHSVEGRRMVASFAQQLEASYGSGMRSMQVIYLPAPPEGLNSFGGGGSKGKKRPPSFLDMNPAAKRPAPAAVAASRQHILNSLTTLLDSSPMELIQNEDEARLALIASGRISEALFRFRYPAEN